MASASGRIDVINGEDGRPTDAILWGEREIKQKHRLQDEAVEKAVSVITRKARGSGNRVRTDLCLSGGKAMSSSTCTALPPIRPHKNFEFSGPKKTNDFLVQAKFSPILILVR